MKSIRGLILLAAPVIGAALLVTAHALRREPAPSAGNPAPARTAPVRPLAPRPAATHPASPPRPAPPDVVAQAAEEARVRATYQNYRTALATGNRPLERALHPALLRDREAALKVAEEELARARTDFDRRVALATVESLRR